MTLETTEKPKRILKNIPWIILALLGFYMIFGWFFIADFPVLRHTEWNALKMFSAQGFSFSPLDTGRPFIPQAVIYLFYLCGGWNIRAYLFFNLLIYAVDLILLYRMILKVSGPNRYLPLFFIPFFSDLNALNLMQITSLQIHLTLLFGFFALDYGFLKERTYANAMFFILFSALSVFSMNFIFAGVLLVCWIVVELLNRSWRRAIGAWILFNGILAVSLLGGRNTFFQDFDGSFKKAIIAVSAMLTGIDIPHPVHFVLMLPIAGVLFYILMEKELLKDRGTVALYAFIAALLFSAVNLIPFPVQPPFSFVHAAAGFIVFAVPVILTLLRGVRPVFVYACCLGVLGYSAAFSHHIFYIEKSYRNLERLCAEAYFNKKEQPEQCALLKDAHTPVAWDWAKSADLHFSRFFP